MTLKPSIGVCYYPEHWPEKIWQKDAFEMKEAGISWVRIAEFAWSRIEPREGDFNFGWLDKVISILTKNNLNIVMCTPTATPPKWVVDKMPDMLPVDEYGIVKNFGSRRHYDFSHSGYIKEASRITEIISKRYGECSSVKAWQTDNEYGCHDTVLSYSKASLDKFRIWLKKKYDSIEKLNDEWGTVFWSQEYNDFHEIELPNLTITDPNPSHLLDFKRYSSDSVKIFNSQQCKIIRKNSPGRPICHNFMGRFTHFDHFDLGLDLDFSSWDSYPLGFLQDLNERGYHNDLHTSRFLRTGDPDAQAFHHDLYRSVGKGRWWIMEQQPGPVNWARHNPVPLSGSVRLWGWEAFAHGAEVVSYFRWRQSPFSQEQMHAGLNLRNFKPSQALQEVKKLASEINEIKFNSFDKSEVAMIFDYNSAWMSEIENQTSDFNYLFLSLDFYKSLRVNSANIDVISPSMPIDGYKLIIIPSLIFFHDDLLEKLKNFQGRIFIGPRSGSKTENFQIPENLAGAELGELVDFKVIAVDAFGDRERIPVKWKGINDGSIKIWREIVETNEETEGLDENFNPLIIKGEKASYLTAWPNKELLNSIMKHEMKKSGLNPIALPEGLRIRRRGNLLIFLNYSDSEKNIPKEFKGKFLIGSQKLQAAEVSVLAIN